MAIRSVDEIINLSDSSKHPEKLAFKDLVKHIDPRIRQRAPRHNSLHFVIPGILWGQPVFDANKVQKMITRHYKRMGFKCVRLDSRGIIIRWGDDDSPGESEHASTTRSDSDNGSEGGTDSPDDSEDSAESAETSETDATTTDSDSDADQDDDSNTKCVTVEQIPLSKRLSIVNNQMQQKM